MEEGKTVSEQIAREERRLAELEAESQQVREHLIQLRNRLERQRPNGVNSQAVR